MEVIVDLVWSMFRLKSQSRERQLQRTQASQVINPAYAHLAEQFPNAVFLEVDVDKLQPT